MSAPRGSGPKVVNGELLHVSASQAKTFELCNRKWFYEAVMGLSTPSTKAQRVGTEHHAAIENWYLKGSPVDATRFPSVALAIEEGVLPTPGAEDRIEIERPLEDPKIYADGVWFKGFIDLIHVAPGHVAVWDWKTTSSLEYAKTAEELLEDYQMSAYGFYVRTRFPDIKKLTIGHIYFTTRGLPQYQVSCTEASWDSVSRTWVAIEDTVRRMKVVAKAVSAEDVEPNWAACNAYGGCPWMAKCGPRAGGGIRKKPTLGLTSMSLSEKLKKNDSSELHLYVDCVPVKGPHGNYVLLDTLIAERQARIAQAMSVQDLRLTSYGEGKMALAADFLDNPPKGVVVAFSSPMAGAVIEALSGIATTVTRST